MVWNCTVRIDGWHQFLNALKKFPLDLDKQPFIQRPLYHISIRMKNSKTAFGYAVQRLT